MAELDSIFHPCPGDSETLAPCPWERLKEPGPARKNPNCLLASVSLPKDRFSSQAAGAFYPWIAFASSQKARFYPI